MILKDVEDLVIGKKQGELIYPRYEDYCLSNIPSAILYLFGRKRTTRLLKVLERAKLRPETSKKIVVILIDGFGYNQWLRYNKKYNFLSQMSKRGTLAPLTTVFPSTTAAALNTFHSGLTPQEHGLPEWFVYFEELEQLIFTLPFSSLKDRPDALLESGTNPSILFNHATLFQKLSDYNIPSFSYIKNTYAQSAYSSLVYKGSIVVPFSDPSALFENLRTKLKSTSAPAYFYVYWDAIDSVAHTYGPHTQKYLAELNKFFRTVERLINSIDRETAKETLLLVTADHGQISVNPKQTTYLNEYPEILENLRRDPDQRPIAPWGSPRDVFVSVAKGKIAQSVARLKEILGNRAKVMETKAAISKGMFGRRSFHKGFESRVGDILILPKDACTVWYERTPDEKPELRGAHGGLTLEEILVPFAVAKVSSLA